VVEVCTVATLYSTGSSAGAPDRRDVAPHESTGGPAVETDDAQIADARSPA
jgi:hypothetical protein